jgi:hypothetical protein
VLSIQFKVSGFPLSCDDKYLHREQRFEQRGTDTYKIDTPVRVPSSINMAPYTTAALDGSGA